MFFYYDGDGKPDLFLVSGAANGASICCTISAMADSKMYSSCGNPVTGSGFGCAAAISTMTARPIWQLPERWSEAFPKQR